MNYLNDERLDALSAAFVTGTLHGRARARFQRLMRESDKARERVGHWQRLLRPVTDHMDEVDDLAADVNAERNWGWVAGFSTAMILMVGAAFLWPQNPPVGLSQLAVFSAEEQPLWVVQVTDDSMTLQATSAVNVSDMYDFELWYVPAVGGIPMSLGLLPEKGVVSQFRPLVLAGVQEGTLLVTREAPGGSVSGSPGTVLFRTELSTF